MKKLGYVFAALGAIAIAAPSIASAETVVIKRGHHDGYGALPNTVSIFAVGTMAGAIATPTRW